MIPLTTPLTSEEPEGRPIHFFGHKGSSDLAAASSASPSLASERSRVLAHASSDVSDSEEGRSRPRDRVRSFTCSSEAGADVEADFGVDQEFLGGGDRGLVLGDDFEDRFGVD
jgi:hypothetical protein